MTEDDYLQSHVEIIKSLIDSTATDDELSEYDVVSIFNAAIITMRQKTHGIKLAYLQSKREG